MRTLIAVAIGVVVAFGFVFIGNLLGRSRVAGAIVFLGVWLIACVVDYNNGVKAGYPALTELAIHTLIFVFPAIGAWLATRLLR